MEVICKKCGITGSSKCPVMRTIFPTPESEHESYFWMGMWYNTEPAGDGWREGVQKLRLEMILNDDEDEEKGLKRLIAKIKSIPNEEINQYICKHSYQHTVDCHICGWKEELCKST